MEQRYPEDTATNAVRIIAAHGTEVAPAYENSEETREALSWCARHVREASRAEENLVMKLVNDDAKVPRTTVRLSQIGRVRWLIFRAGRGKGGASKAESFAFTAQRRQNLFVNSPVYPDNVR